MCQQTSGLDEAGLMKRRCKSRRGFAMTAIKGLLVFTLSGPCFGNLVSSVLGFKYDGPERPGVGEEKTTNRHFTRVDM